MWKHKKLSKPNLKVRGIVIFLASFTLAYGIFNYRFITSYIYFKLNSNSFVEFSPNPKEVVHLPISDFRSNTPLPANAEIIIEKLDIRAPIVFNLADDEKVIFNNLENGVVNYPGTVKPGEAGLSLLLGHSSALPWYKGDYGSVFALLGQLKKDDIFYVRYSDGRTFTYKMYDSVIFSPLSTDDSYLKLEGDSNLVLLSCWPVGTSYKRIAIKAKLI